MSKKPRGDSRLKTLPPAVQAELFTQCQGKGGYDAARAWLLAEHNVKTSAGSLSNFFGWYPFSLSATASYAQQFEAELKKLPALREDAAQLSQLSQLGFEMLAMRTNDLEGYATLKKIRLKEHEQSLTERRVALLEAKAKQADEAKQITDNAELSDAEKLARYKAIFGS